MQRLNYTEDHHRFRKKLRKFCEKEIQPFVEQWEKDHIVPKEVWKKMGRQGFLCTAVSPEYGGIGGDFLYSVIALEEVSRTNHYGLDAFLHSDIVVPYIDSYGSEEIKQKYLPGCVTGDCITAIAMTEPNAGSDLASIAATAVEDGDFAVLNGSKTFISNGINCDLVIVAAKDPLVQNPYQAISLYLIEDGTPGFKKGEGFEKLGVKSQDTTELFFTNCKVPLKNRLGEKRTGFVKMMEKLQQERILVALVAQSKAEYILDWILDWKKDNNGPVLNPKSPQAVQFALVEMSTEIKLGRTFLDKLIVDHMEGKNVVTEVSMAKYWITEMADRVANRALDLCGEWGALESCPIVRTFRDVRVTTIYAGTNEIMKGIVAKQMGF